MRGIDDDGSLLEFLMPLAQRWLRLIIYTLLGGALGIGISFVVPKTFLASTTLLPPQQQQSMAASALASLGALAGLSGISGALSRSPADQFVSLMLSVNTTDRLIDDFGLIKVYDVEQKWQARKKLMEHTSIAVGKKDGLITVSVEDRSPERAAALANRYVQELRRLTSQLALTEAQERRVFFEAQLARTRDQLAAAQTSLQASGFNSDALKAEPKAAAEGYAKLRAELTTAEVRLQALRSSFADTSPEVRAMQDTVVALRSQLARSEAAREAAQGGADYVGKYREFKYQETLFELMSKQYELARVDESREGILIQVLDEASVPEHKLQPKRSIYAVVGALIAFLAFATYFACRARLDEVRTKDPVAYARWQAFKDAWKLRARQ